MCHPAQIPIERLLADCRFDRTRRTGPGGQHRNKVETAVVVVHLPTGLRSEASERRSQAQNRSVAIQRLRIKLASAVRHEPTISVSETWQQRVAGKKISVNSEHQDFPALLAEALDCITAQEFDFSAAASHLGVTSSQLIKFLKAAPAAMGQVNQQREKLGLPLLR